MRILLVGNYDVAGQYLALRLFKENHIISWLTGENERKLWEAPVKGNVYRYKLNYQNCSHIIQTEAPDVVVFLTQNYRDCYEWNETGLISINDNEIQVLRAASACGVKKIVYLSSKEVAGNELLNPCFEKLRNGERLCLSVCREKNMQCLIVRSGIVYGSMTDMGYGYINDILMLMKDKKRISSSYTRTSSFDFLYGSDFADAVERLLSDEATGIHTIATGYPITNEDFFNKLSECMDYHIPVEYGKKDHKEDPVDSVRFKQDTGWLPFYMFDKTIGDVIKDTIYINDYKGKKKKKAKEKNKVPFLKELLQNLLLFVLMTFINVGSSDWSDIRFVDIKLLYVVIIAISFGMRQGIIATVMASLAYIMKQYLSGVDLAYIAYSIDTWIPFIIYGLAGAVVGYITDKKNDELDTIEEEYNNINEKYNFLKSMYTQVLNIKNQLQKQILISKDSLGHIYEITEELDDTHPRTVMIRTVKAVEDTMECESVAIYVRGGVNSLYGRLVACSGNIVHELKTSINFTMYPEMEEAIKNKEMFVNIELLHGYPGFAMPVFDGDDMVALVCIYNLDPDKYTVYYKNLFKTLILIMRSCLVRAYRYQSENKERIYMNNTGILCPEEFYTELNSIIEAGDDFSYPYSVGRIYPGKPLDNEEMWKVISHLVRGTDIVGCDEEGNIHIILLFIVPSQRLYMEKRFNEAGLSIEWEN